MATELGVTFPLAYGVAGTDVAAYAPEWADDHRGHYLQPMEFLIAKDGAITGSLYASGGVGRMDVGDVIRLIRGRDERANR